MTYWINTKEFCGVRGSPQEPCERQKIVAASLAQAAKDWQDSCPECGISFTMTDRKPDATFIVRYITSVKLPSGGKQRPEYIARSFFPTSETKNRVLRIAPNYFNSTTDQVGVIRHEFGHILGYAHENKCQGDHTPPPRGLRSQRVTEPDDQSVMNTPCEALASGTAMTLSANDVAGHKTIYGPAGTPAR